MLLCFAAVACSAPHDGSVVPPAAHPDDAAARISPDLTPPGGTISLSGPITALISGGFTIKDAHAGYMHVYTNSSTAYFGAKPAVGLYAQAVGTGSFSTSETAYFVSDWSSAPSSIATAGTVVASTGYGFTLNVDAGHTAVPIAWYASTSVPSGGISVGEKVNVSGAGSTGQAIVATQITAGGPTPTPSPTSSPTSAPITMLPNTTGAFSAIQILDRQMSPAQIQQEAPYEPIVWGAFDPTDWKKYNPSMYVSRYMIPMNDDSSISGHNLTWWQQNHNDWILYACDQNGNPTKDVPRADGFPDVPLAFWNPSVINYQLQLIVPWMVSKGYNALAVDQVSFFNYLMAPNSLFGEGPAQPGWFGCGSYSGSGGAFVKRYFQGYAKPDPAFIADIINWVQTVKNTLATDPVLKQYHIKLLVNHPLPGSSTIDSNEQALVASIDGMINEDGFSNYDRYGVYIPNYILYMQYAQSHHVAFWDVNYFCLNNGNPCETQVTTQQLDYAMAAHQLGNEGGAGMFVSPSTGDIPSYHTEYQTKLGTPCSEYGTTGTYMYYRRFSGGFVVANNNSTLAQSITLPSNHTYTAIDNRSITNPLTVQPLDGYVLTTTGNGCQ